VYGPAALLLGARPAEPWRVPAVRLTGARVSGVLDLSFAEIRHAALLRDCVFDAPVDLGGARIRQLNLAGSRLPGLTVSDVQIDGLLWLDDCRFEGSLELVGARIDGALSLRSARFTADLRADSLTVARTLDAEFGGARLANPGGRSLTAYGLKVGTILDCSDGFHAEGPMSFMPFAARIWGFVQEWTVGYGYRPLRAGAWLAGLLLAGTAVFGAHHPAPLHRGEAPGFNPLLYTLDLLLPIIDFGQQGAFDPRGGQQWLAALLIAAGWILATTIAAGATRVLSRQ
jgi:hypothetical protein